jgi:hypothetical protein
MNITQNKPIDIMRWYPLLKCGLVSKIKKTLGNTCGLAYNNLQDISGACENIN